MVGSFTGIKIMISDMLPVEKVVTVYDIETRKERTIYTGEFIHAFKVGEAMYMSKELNEQILEELNKKDL